MSNFFRSHLCPIGIFHLMSWMMFSLAAQRIWVPQDDTSSGWIGKNALTKNKSAGYSPAALIKTMAEHKQLSWPGPTKLSSGREAQTFSLFYFLEKLRTRTECRAWAELKKLSALWMLFKFGFRFYCLAPSPALSKLNSEVILWGRLVVHRHRPTVSH